MVSQKDPDHPGQKDCLEFIGKWINAAPVGVKLLGPDERTAKDLLKRHHDYKGKVGAGVDHFEVRPARRNRTLRELWVVRVDGSEEVFSWRKCIIGEPKKREYIMDALRHAVEPQILDFRRTFFANTQDPTCPISGAALRNDTTTHIDHDEPQFFELSVLWIAQQGGESNVPLEDQPTSNTSRVLADPAQLKSWIDYHREEATLRAVSASSNLRRGRKNGDS